MKPRIVTSLLVSFPGSQSPWRMKNWKERGEPGKIQHVRNITDREYLFSCESLITADRTGLDVTTLPYLAVRKAMVSVHRPHTFENHTNFHTCLSDKLTQYNLENGFQGAIGKRQGSPFLGFAETICALVWNNCRNRLLLQHGYVYCWLHNYVRAHRRFAYAQLSPTYLLSSLYVTHLINHPGEVGN